MLVEEKVSFFFCLGKVLRKMQQKYFVVFYFVTWKTAILKLQLNKMQTSVKRTTFYRKQISTALQKVYSCLKINRKKDLNKKLCNCICFAKQKKMHFMLNFRDQPQNLNYKLMLNRGTKNYCKLSLLKCTSMVA